MKKIFLSLVFVFAFVAVTPTSAKSNVEEATAIAKSCFEQAWDYGTAQGNGDPYWEWYYTNQYYNQNCAEA